MYVGAWSKVEDPAFLFWTAFERERMTVHVHDKEEALFSFEKIKEEADLKKFSLFKNKERASQQWRTTLAPFQKFS